MNYVELMGSREASRSHDSYTASRTFLVYKNSGNLTLEDAVNYSGGVSFSDQHPDINGIFANSFSIKASSTRADTWALSWSYAQPVDPTDAGGDDDQHDNDGDNTEIDPQTGGEFEPPTDPDASTGSETEDEVGDEGTGEAEPDPEMERLYTGVSITTGVSIVDGWVGGGNIPSGGTQPADASYISGGNQIHSGGKAVSVAVPKTEMSLSETVFGEYFYLNGVQQLAGKRNSSNFYGFNTGSVLFTGMSVQRNDISTWDATYNFVWDAWSHLRQAPERNDDGEVVIDGGVVNVNWKQPFPDTTAFTFSP